MTVEPFVFETTYDASAARRAMVARAQSSGVVRQDQLLIATGIAGFLLLLLSWYTFALGAALLALGTFAFAMKHRTRAVPDRLAATEPKPLTVRVTDTGYSIASPSSSATGTWENVRSFTEMGGYLNLNTWHTGTMFLPIEELRAAGVYERIKALAEERRAAFAAAMQAAT